MSTKIENRFQVQENLSVPSLDREEDPGYIVSAIRILAAQVNCVIRPFFIALGRFFFTLFTFGRFVNPYLPPIRCAKEKALIEQLEGLNLSSPEIQEQFHYYIPLSIQDHIYKSVAQKEATWGDRLKSVWTAREMMDKHYRDRGIIIAKDDPYQYLVPTLKAFLIQFVAINNDC